MLFALSDSAVEAQQATKVPRIGFLRVLAFRSTDVGPYRGISARSARARLYRGEEHRIEYAVLRRESLNVFPELAA